jgi:hypothetical protein
MSHLPLIDTLSDTSMAATDQDDMLVDAEEAAIVDGFTLTKAELAEMLFDRVGLNKREAKDMVETFFDEIRDALERGDDVIPRPVKRFQSRHEGWSPFTPARNSRH